jgi:hypothetical protein
VHVDVQPPRIYERCARAYERALRLAPGLHEARARLARVLVAAGRFDEAARALEPLLRAGADVPGRTRYLALLFHGRAMMGLARADAAAASYRAAGELFPGCPAPQVALSTAVRAAGDQTAAHDLMMGVLTGADRRPCQDDPWWDYIPGQAWRLESLVASLHEGVRR